MSRYTSEAQLAKDAMAVQDASNLPGILLYFHEGAVFLLRGDKEVNTHPAMQLFASKITSLTRMGLSDHRPFNLAWVACEALAEGEK